MSAGVSDQRMKGQGNQVNTSNKNVDSDRTSIPWSQQVDEAYENLSSPTEGNQSGSYDSSSGGGTQFQNPPFNVKENSSGAWSGNKSSSSRRYSNHDNYENDNDNKRSYNQSYGQYHQSSSHNHFSRNGDYNSSWAAQVNAAHQQPNTSRRSNNHDDYYNRSERNNYQNDNYKSVQRGIQNLGLENNENRPAITTSTPRNTLSNATSTDAAKTKSAAQTTSAPKKMTWASVASQPPKVVQRIHTTTSTLKKKGPGMPPPPMVPGKHNMDIGMWDSPKNGQILAPPSPPPIIPVPIMEPSPLSQSKSASNTSNNNNNNSNINNNDVPPAIKGEHPQHMQNQKPRSGYHHHSGNETVQSNTNTRSNQNIRPPWLSQNNPPPKGSTESSGNYNYPPQQQPQQQQQQRPNFQRYQNREGGNNQRNNTGGDYYNRENDSGTNFRRGGGGGGGAAAVVVVDTHQHDSSYTPPVASPELNAPSNIPVLEQLYDRNNYNPPELDLSKADVARFFVIKSYSEDDVHRSIKYEIWCSTEHGNKRLDEAFRETESNGGVIYLLFSVNGSGHFCGVAQMMTRVDYDSVSNVWSQDKWKGNFKVKWIYVKDVPNTSLRHIHLENNENRAVTNSRDTQEVPNKKGIEVLRIIHGFHHKTSLFDDFFHYEERQKEEKTKKHTTHFTRSSQQPLHDNARGIYRSGDYERQIQGNIEGRPNNRNGGAGGTGSYHGDRNSDNRPVSRERNTNRGYQNFNHRNFGDRNVRDNGSFKDNKGIGGRGENINNRDNDYYNNRGEFYRGNGGNDFGRRDERGNFNNRDRENYNERYGNFGGGFMNRDRGGSGENNGGGRSIGPTGGETGAFRDKERDFHPRGRSNRETGGAPRN